MTRDRKLKMLKYVFEDKNIDSAMNLLDRRDVLNIYYYKHYRDWKNQFS